MEHAQPCFLADLDHHPGTKSPAGGHNLPTILTHATTFSFEKRRIALGREYFSVHGFALQAYDHRELLLGLEPDEGACASESVFSVLQVLTLKALTLTFRGSGRKALLTFPRWVHTLILTQEPSQQIFLVGNSLFLPAAAAWVCYVLSRLVLRDSSLAMSLENDEATEDREVASAAGDDDNEGEEEEEAEEEHLVSSPIHCEERGAR